MTCKQCKDFEKCSNEADLLSQTFDPNYDGEHGCTEFATHSNHDHIKSMNAEEFATWLVELDSICDCCPHAEVCDCDVTLSDLECKQYILNWLQQPME